MTRTAVEADVLVPSPEQIDDGLRRHPFRSLALDQELAVRYPSRLEVFRERRSEILIIGMARPDRPLLAASSKKMA
jgi:hypothetical protein